MLEDGLSYPVRGDWIGRIAIGGILGFLSIFVLPYFVIMGYIVDVLRETVAGNDEPPEFDDWGDLFVDGLKATAIGFVYSIVPIAIWGVLTFVLVLGGGALGEGAGLASLLLAMLLFIPVSLLIYYLVPAALTNFATDGSIGAAFDFGTLKPVLLSTDYLVAVLMPLLVAVLLNVVVSVLAFTVIGGLLVPFVTFYAQVAIFHMFGLAFAKTNGRDTASGVGAASPV